VHASKRLVELADVTQAEPPEEGTASLGRGDGETPEFLLDWVGSSDRQIVQAVGSEGDGLCHAEHELRLAEAPCSLLQPEVLVDCLEQPHGLGSLTQQNRPGVAGDVEIRGANVDRARVSRYPHLGDASCSRRCCVWTSPSSLHRRHFRWIAGAIFRATSGFQ